MKLKGNFVSTPIAIIALVIILVVGVYLTLAIKKSQDEIKPLALPLTTDQDNTNTLVAILPTISIEATVVSVSKDTLPENGCAPICENLHPQDTGKIQIDKITDQTNDPRSLVKSKVGDIVDVVFSYSAQPAKVLRDPVLDQPQAPADPNSITSYSIRPVEFKEGYYYFYRSILKDNEVILPGLEKGQKIKVKDFSVSNPRISVYEIISDNSITDSNKTSDWQTYTNDEYGFSFKYPKEYTVSNLEGKHQGVNISYSKETDIGLGNGIDIYKRSDNEAYELVIKTVESNPGMTKLAQKLIGNHKWDAYSYDSSKDPGATDQRSSIIYYLQKDDSIYVISGNIVSITEGLSNQTVKNNYEGILSTFKFTNSTVETVDWQTYTNDDYGFSFKYPKDWNVGEVKKSGLFIQNSNTGISTEYDAIEVTSNEKVGPYQTAGGFTIWLSNLTDEDFIQKYNGDDDEVSQVTKAKSSAKLGNNNFIIVTAGTAIGVDVEYYFFDQESHPIFISSRIIDTLEEQILATFRFNSK